MTLEMAMLDEITTKRGARIVPGPAVVVEQIPGRTFDDVRIAALPRSAAEARRATGEQHAAES